MAKVAVEPNALSPEMLTRIRDIALDQVRLVDELAAALHAGDTARVLCLAMKIAGIEQQGQQEAVCPK